MKKIKYEEMLPNEFLNEIKETPVFFVPIGLLEWHGDHLPLGLDALNAYGLCLEAAKGLMGVLFYLPAILEGLVILVLLGP